MQTRPLTSTLDMNEVKKFIILLDRLKKEFNDKTSSIGPKFKIKLRVLSVSIDAIKETPSFRHIHNA